jgi:hypothetical protein
MKIAYVQLRLKATKKKRCRQYKMSRNLQPATCLREHPKFILIRICMGCEEIRGGIVTVNEVKTVS